MTSLRSTRCLPLVVGAGLSALATVVTAAPAGASVGSTYTFPAHSITAITFSPTD